jgi:peptidoglycan hydrolase-like protein with peptidoglycan-binding domain/DNA invertase Pin-like site-specific DNA recombinase
MRHILGAPGVVGLALTAGLLLAWPAVSAAQAAGDGAPRAGTSVAIVAPDRDTARFAGWEAGAVELGAGMRSAHGSRRVREVQRRLRAAGFSPGPVDGRFGRRTAGAVLAFQDRFGLVRDGVVGSQTLHALRLGAALPTATRRVKALQRRLRRLGHDPGPADGRFGARTRAAVTRFQAAHDLPATGNAGPRTLLTLWREARQRPATRVRATDAETARKDTRARTGTRSTAKSDGVAWASLEPTADPASTGDGGAGGGAGITAGAMLAVVALLIILLLRSAVATVRRSPEAAAPAVSDAVLAPAEPRPQPSAAQAPAAVPATAFRAVGYALIGARGSEWDLQDETRRLHRACEERDLTLVRVWCDVEGAVGREQRPPGLQAALDCIAEGRASVLLVSTLRSLGRSAGALSDVLGALTRSGAKLVVLGFEIDTATPEGWLAAQTLAAPEQVERDWRAHRSIRGLRAAHPGSGGADRRSAAEEQSDLHARIVAMRAEGLTLRAIVDALNAEVTGDDPAGASGPSTAARNGGASR